MPGGRLSAPAAAPCAPLPRQECPCPCRACPPREVRALSRQAAFLERLLCSPCQAGHPLGAAGGAKLWNASCPPF